MEQVESHVRISFKNQFTIEMILTYFPGDELAESFLKDLGNYMKEIGVKLKKESELDKVPKD